MTIKELKIILSSFPDDSMVFIDIDDRMFGGRSFGDTLIKPETIAMVDAEEVSDTTWMYSFAEMYDEDHELWPHDGVKKVVVIS